MLGVGHLFSSTIIDVSIFYIVAVALDQCPLRVMCMLLQ